MYTEKTHITNLGNLLTIDAVELLFTCNFENSEQLPFTFKLFLISSNFPLI